jgi:hypothetical protein
MASKTIKNAWKTTGNYPISRRKALIHPEIQVDKEKRRAPDEIPGGDSDDQMPKSGRDIMDMAGPNATALERRKYRQIGRAFNSKEAELAVAKRRIEELEAQVARFSTKKRKAVPNPNRKFMQIEEILGKEQQAGNALNQRIEPQQEVLAEIAVAGDEEVEDDFDEEDDMPAEVRTGSGRHTKVPRRYGE